MSDKVVEFKGRVLKKTYSTDTFKIFVCDVDTNKYRDVKKHPQYGTTSIMGDLPDLSLDVEYEIKAIEQSNKYGISYKVLNIRRDIPSTSEDIKLFLQEILTSRQADVLYESYPNIIELVKEKRVNVIDVDKLSGIGQYTLDKIVKKIEENFVLIDLVTKFQGFLSMSIIRKIYTKYSSVEVLQEKLKKDPYKCLCGISGIGFKTADDILLKMEKASKENIKKGKEPIIEFESDLKSSPQRCLAYILFSLRENETNGNTKMNLAELRRSCIDNMSECAEHFVDAIKDKAIYYDKSTMDIALKGTYDTEKYIADRMIEALNDEQIVWDYDIEKYRNVGGFDLSDEQMGVLKNVCKYNVSMLNGGGGTGKTNSTIAIINMLKDNKKTFELFAPTGKASKIISEYTNESASTIHRGLGYSPETLYYKNGIISDKDNYDYRTRFINNRYNKFKIDVLIVDEFSMVDCFLFKSLLEALDSNKTKLLMIGDNSQLCSVGASNLLHDFMQSNVVPTTTLTKVFRYGDGGLMKVATDVRFCKPYLSRSMKNKVTTFGDNKDYTFVDIDSNNVAKNVIALYKKLLSNGESVSDIQVLVAKNVGSYGTIVLNNMIQSVANKNYGSEINMKVGDTTYYIGDMVMQTQNNYKAKLDMDYVEHSDDMFYDGSEDELELTAFVPNGDMGIILQITNKDVTIDFDGVVVKYSRSDMNMVSLGYVMTIHKSQGSGFKNVILCTTKSDTYMINSNLIYVGITRTKKRCFHLGTLYTVNQAVTKKANLERHTFMQQLLAERK